MKGLSIKGIIMTRGIRIIFAVMMLLAAASCNGRGEAGKNPSTDFATYIKAYTGNIVHSSSAIRIELQTQPQTMPEEGLFSFSPAIKGHTRWLSPTSVEFIPEEGEMKPGKTYDGTFRLDRLFKVGGKDMKEFVFSFSTIAEEAQLTIEGVRISEDDILNVSVSGTLSLSTAIQAEDAARCLKADYPGGDVEVTVASEGLSDIHSFVVSGISPGTEDRALTISFNGRKAGYDASEKAEVLIPETGSFKVIDVKAVNAGEPYVDVRFSQPIATMSDYTGLIRLEGISRQIVDVKDNAARIYYEKTSRDQLKVIVDAGIKSYDSQRLSEDYVCTIDTGEHKPEVILPLKGNILPDTKSLVIPFKAVNLSAVDIRIIKIYEDNMLMFLQDNSLDGDSQLRRSGRLAYRQTIRLDGDRDRNLKEWNDYTVDLGGIIKQEPGALYRIRISYRQDYSLYGKGTPLTSDYGDGLVHINGSSVTEEEEAVWDEPYAYYYEDLYDWSTYSWKDREDPTTPSYYMVASRFPECNLLSTNLGIIVKSADTGHIWVNVNDIMTTAPVSGAEVKVYDFQLQEIGSEKTDKDGSAKISLDARPFVVTASAGKTKSYLKVIDGTENSLSRFDTGGKKLENGLKGFAYGERGVWRPGDTLRLNLIIDDPQNRIPDNHPATLELYTPQGQFHSKLICQNALNGFYRFDVTTRDDDPTGTWNAYFKVGGATFHKSLPVETIKPNRLKIDLNVRPEILTGGKNARMEVTSSWLTGPAAAGLKASAEMTLRTGGETFKGYEGYMFTNPSKKFSSAANPLFDVTLNAEGKAVVNVPLPPAKDAPGMLTADIITKVAEPGGDESIVVNSMPYSPFSAYAGIRMPQTDSFYETDKDHTFSVAVVDKDGRRVSGHNMEYVIYRIGWDWWWENGAESLDSYVNSSSAKIHSHGSFRSAEKDYDITFNLAYPDWGRFFIYVKDIDSGHSCGSLFTADWPLWRGRADRSDPDALTMLTFSTDKTEYEVGEDVTVYIPAAKGGRALVSIETGRGIISQEWVETSAEGETQYRAAVTKDMAPNFYIHITLLQPHSRTGEGLPVRMYGVQPVLVSDKASVLNPVITMPDVIRPQEPFKVRIKEKEGRQMTYTLAIVDEGLLDITGFRTPDPWASMYAREALGVKTWDLYDNVMGAFGGRLSPMFSIGGDEYVNQGSKRDNRFNPVVEFLGPFTAKGGNTHEICLPMYVGSVRVMVVAGQDGAYGNAEKTVPVRSPLMVLPTVPRVLGTGERVALPVNVFALEENVSDVKVSINVEGAAELVSEASTGLSFARPGDQMSRFTICGTGEGTAVITVTAQGGGFTAKETISLPVRNPNSGRLARERKMIAAGESTTFSWKDDQMMTAEWAKLEAAGFPSIDINALFTYVSDYSHYCTEQISARGLSLVHTMDLLDEDNKEKAAASISELIQLLYSRQLADGGFSYWPSQTNPHGWATTMAGHFLTDAAAKGFDVSRSVMESWKKYQKKLVKAYRHSGLLDLNDLQQAYSLYTLALAGSPDNGAMNRLKESMNLSVQAKWMLASAYAICGKKSIAADMLSDTSADIADYPEADRTFGSPARDKSLALEAYVLSGEVAKALGMAEEVAELIDGQGYTTQSAAFASVAMGRLSEAVSDKAIKLEITQDETITAKVAKAHYSCSLKEDFAEVTVKNTSDEPVYIGVTTYGRPAYGVSLPAEASGLLLDVKYRNLSGEAIDPVTLKQGTEFIAEVTVANTSQTDNYRNLALTMAIPSGWEIYNERLYGGTTGTDNSTYTYNDIRDDRTVFYFDLPAGQRKTFRTRLSAVYEGSFTLPSVKCEAMYDNGIYAYSASGAAVVTR